MSCPIQNWADEVTSCDLDYAPTSRSKCGQCDQTINKGNIRLGVHLNTGRFSSRPCKFFHPNCLSHIILKASLTRDDFNSFDDLEKSDQGELSNLFKLTNKKKKKATKAADEKKKMKKMTKTTKTTKTKTVGGKRKRKPADSEDDDDDDDSEDSEEGAESSEEEVVPKKGRKKKKEEETKTKAKNKAPKSPKKKTKEQLEIEGFEEQLESETLNSLKEMLRTNLQPVGGTKSELIHRIAEGKVRGALPKCPKCGGGNLYPEGKRFSCRGFYDDDHFHRCRFSGSESDFVRNPWTNPQAQQ